MDLHVGQLELQGLARKRLAREARVHVLHACIQGALRKSNAEGGDCRTRHVERLHGDLHSLAFLPKKVGGRNVNVFQKQFDSVGSCGFQACGPPSRW